MDGVLRYIPWERRNRDNQEKSAPNKVLDAYLGKIKRWLTEDVNKQSAVSTTSLVSFRDCDRNTGRISTVKCRNNNRRGSQQQQQQQQQRSSSFRLQSGGVAALRLDEACCRR
jgi:hypothetical protein